MVEGETHDAYIAPTLSIKIKGFSSLPAPDNVYEKQKSGKGLTPSEDLVAKELAWFDNVQPKVSNPEQLLAWIKEQLVSIRMSLTQLRAVVQRAKFAVLLGHKWFQGVDKKNPLYDYNGYQFTFAIGEKEIQL